MVRPEDEKPARESSSRIPRNIVALGVVSLFTDSATEMIYPLIPLFVATLGSGALVLGVIEGVAETTAAWLKLATGIVSDRMRSRKKLVLAGYAVSTLARPFTGIVSSAWQIVFVRMMDRVGKGIRTAPRDALIASSVDRSMYGKAYGFHRAMDHTGAVIGPLLAIVTLLAVAFLAGVRETNPLLRWVFLLSLVPGCLAVITIIFFVRERQVPSAGPQPFRFSLRQFDRNFLTYLGVILLFTLGNSSDAFMLFRVEEAVNASGALLSFVRRMPVLGDLVGLFAGAREQQAFVDALFLPLVWAFFHVIKAAFSTPLGALSDRVGRKRVITAGWGIYAAVYLAFAFLDRLPGTWQLGLTFVLFAVYALYYAFSEGAEKAFVADTARPEVHGSAFGMYNFVVGLGSLPASVVFGILYKAYGGAVAFGTGALLAFVSMILLSTVVREQPAAVTLSR